MAVSQISANIEDRPPLVLANHLLPLRVLLPYHLPALLCLPTLPPFLSFLDYLRLLDESARRKVDVLSDKCSSFSYFGLDVRKSENKRKRQKVLNRSRIYSIASKNF